jgi:predicted RNA-binding Zn ribbon-like protein
MEVAVSVAEELPEVKEKLIVDQEWLADAVVSILKGDADAPETLARVFISFRDAIRSGLRGMNQLDGALAATIETIYLQSSAHVAALKLYVLAQEGHLRVEDEPLNVLGAAIARSRAGAERERIKARGGVRRRA